jgi:hypothetical protein
MRTEPLPPPIEPAAPETVAPPAEVIDEGPSPTPAAVTLPLDVAVVLSQDLPAYGDVARALQRQSERATVTLYSLEGKAATIASTMTRIQESTTENVVAVGLLAAEATRRLQDKKVVFCQVFNYHEHELIDPFRRGVSVLPAPAEWFRIWKEISPGLEQVGVIAGEGHEDLLREAQASAADQGMSLRTRVVSSDKEAEYEFLRLLPEVGGLWLLPDNRVLSRDVLGEILSYGRKHQIQVLVNTPQLLAMGGLLSVSARSNEIADAALTLLETARDARTLQGPDMAALHRFDLRINGPLARAFGLSVPATYRNDIDPSISR